MPVLNTNYLHMNIKNVFLGVALMACTAGAYAAGYEAERVSASISLKVPGNDAVHYSLTPQKLRSDGSLFFMEASENIPVTVSQQIEQSDSIVKLNVIITALDDIYFNYSQLVPTGFRHDDCQFYLPGFWYHRNLRSPDGAPSYRVSDSWVVREDRLSSPLTGIYDQTGKRYMTVNRLDAFACDALTTHKEGEVILSGKTSVGFTGFENKEGMAMLSFGFPYKEAPKSYIRKLTLAPSIEAYQHLEKGESVLLTWELVESKADSYSDFIRRVWEFCYDTYKPQPVNTPYTEDFMKETMSRYFISSLVTDKPLVYTSGVAIRTADCLPHPSAEIGFVGRVLLNAFNAWEYGWQQNRDDLKNSAQQILDSYLKNGFTSAGFFREYVDFNREDNDPVLSIRRQSEGIYAILHYLAYEKENGRRHPEWDKRMKSMLDMFLQLQNEDGSFPRKFRDNYAVVDQSGGSTPSATLPLVMGYKYFKDKRYLEGAKRTADYLEKEIISKSDYFSSTLDANCEDKEASLYAATATYYLALVTKGEEHQHYAALSKEAAYFALSWYYLWDVPFAEGQMLGDLGLKTRGWGNVSVENNHIDVFVFEFASVLQWLAEEFDETRFSDFAEVISTSMRQLLPYEGHMCGIAKVGYYPEVVQHTNWDYGKNGKGYYNDIFAPGWTVASLWELLTPGRAEHFLQK